MPVKRKSLKRKSLKRKSLKRKSLKRSLRKRVSGGGWFNKTDEDKFKDTSDLYNRLKKLDPKSDKYKKLMKEYNRKINHDEAAKFADRVNKALDDPNYWGRD